MALLEERRGCCQLLLIGAILVASSLLFFVIGALGPPATMVTHHPLSMCIVASTQRHIRDSTFDLIDDKKCKQVGKILELESARAMRAYPPKNIIFYAQIPFREDFVMSRLFQFLLVDLGIQLSSSDYAQKLMEHSLNTLHFEAALGYRDTLRGPWQRLAKSNVTRTLKCTPNIWRYHSCDHLPFFELGSCHHKQYVVNLLLPSLPLGNVEEYRGLAPISQLSAYVIHQTLGFTQLWLILKCLLSPLSLIILLWFYHRVALLPTPSLLERSLGFVGMCLVFYNAPLELLSLYLNCPWLLVINDFRQGIFVAALFSFWVIFVGEHRMDKEVKSHVGHYWKQIGVVGVSCVFLFVYEFCERGVQVLFPFYSFWSNWLTSTIAMSFVTMAGVSGMLYAAIFLWMVVGAYRNLKQKQKTLPQMSVSAKKRFEGLFFRWRFFLLVTVVVGVVSVGTVLLPSQALLLHWQKGRSYFSFYSGLITGNYGLWNTYVLLMMVLYAPTQTDANSGSLAENEGAPTTESDVAAAQRMLSKQSQE